MKTLLITLLALSPVLSFALEKRNGPSNSAAIVCADKANRLKDESNVHLANSQQVRGKSNVNAGVLQ